MSNTKNLANLAAALDDGTSGQVLQSTGSGGVAFADSSGSGVTVHANQAAMLTDAASADEGTLHYETGTNKLYVKQSSGFYLLASITNASPTIDSFSENTGGAGANNLTAGGTFKLTAGSNTVVTINATEPDLETISYSATVTSGTATDVFSSPSFPVTNQSSNVFTLTPVTSGTGGTVTIRFDASDGTNVANVSHSFEIAFQIADSHFTSLLMATDGSAGDNNDITDSSSNNHTITVNGDAHAGTFSPYRHGGYSTYFDGNDYLAVTKSTDLDLDTNNWTIECWLNLTNPSATQAVYSFGYETQTTRGCIIYLYGGNLHFAYSTTGSNNTDTSMGSHGIVANEWTHLSVVRNGSTITGYINGAALGTTINIGASDIYYPSSGSVRIGGDGTNFVTGYISDFRLVNGTATAPASGGPTERLTAVTNTKLLACHLPYFADGSSSGHSITVSGDPETKPFGPYDYEEYSESINGGSVYFDGTGDYLSYSAGNEIGFGISDFTVEFWAYNEFSAGSLQKIIETRTASTWLIQIDSSNFKWFNGNTHFNYDISYTKNTWSHFVVTRDGTTLRLFVNGRLVSTSTDTASYSVSSGTVYISRRYNDNLDYFSGYLADLRVVKGSVVTEYQTSSTTTDTQIFTPPTAPLTAITNTSLLLSGTDAHVIDKSQNYNLELVGNATASTTQTKFSNTASVYFDGNGDYVSVSDLGLSGDITIEGWFYQSVAQSATFRCLTGSSTYSSSAPLRIYTNGSAVRAYVSTSTYISGSFTANSWFHLALVRSSGTWTLYIDGVSAGTSTTSGAYNFASTTDWYIGAAGPDGYPFTGYIQDFRISAGKARYTSNFTVPSAPLKG